MNRWYTNVYVVIIVLISLLGIATSGLLFLLIPGPDEIMRQAQARMTALSTFQIDLDLRYRGDQVMRAGASPESFSLTYRSHRETGDPALSDAVDAFTLSVGADTAENRTFGGDRVAIGRSQFFRFGTLPDQVGAMRFDRFRDAWLRVDVPRLLSLTSLPLFGSGRAPFDAEERAALLRDFRVTPFVRQIDTLSSEKLGGKDMYHYKIRPEILFFRDYYANVEALRLGRELSEVERRKIESAFADMTPEDGEIWIGKRDRLPHRMRLRFRLDDGVRRGTFDLTAEFSRFNEPVVATAPTGDVQDATPFLESLLMGLRSHLPLAKEGAARQGDAASGGGLPVDRNTPGDDDPDRDGLPNALEGFYLTDPADADTDDDGMNDGAEVAQGRNPGGEGQLFDFGTGR